MGLLICNPLLRWQEEPSFSHNNITGYLLNL